MLYSRDVSLEDQITQLLLSAPSQVKKLHIELSVGEKSLSLRAVYKAIGNLIEAGVLMKVGKVVRINEEWVRTVRHQLRATAAPQLSPGERMTHSFTSMTHLDTFWKTIVLQLEEYEKDGQIFFYNPHNFWAHLPDRFESESAYYAHFAESRLHAFFTLGGESLEDKDFKKQYQNDYLQIDTRNIPSIPRNTHLTVLGNYVVTVRVSKALSGYVDTAYSKDLPSQELKKELERLYNLPFSSRFTLEHNPQKARVLRRLLSRNFYFMQKTA